MPPALDPSDTYQSWYDKNRILLGHSIESAIEQLQGLRAANASLSLRYPISKPPPQPLVEIDDIDNDNDNDDDDDKACDAVKPLAASLDLLVLRLDVRFGASTQSESLQLLGKDAISSMLDEKISTCIRQLTALRERIDDPLSKILVTGDVNAGKSTFCNALLRRRILPENQQPCTAIFCEVINADKNSGLEGVHAATEWTTYDTYALQDLDQVVVDARYTQCKVFVDDLRTADESLLGNKDVVDIILIDAPGLNHDTTHTTAVFARQEEIDVVVFVVSAANHFTISAKDFIRAATAEKKYLFIVVNAFDTIVDKEQCKRRIMEQIRHLSPQTFEESHELVHFVSCNAVLPPHPAVDTKFEGKLLNGDGLQDFEHLERSLRKFVLGNRAKSKLAPAMTYLLNILHDVHSLAAANIEAAHSQLDRSSKAVKSIAPQLESHRKALIQVSDQIDSTIESTSLDVFNHCRSTIGAAIIHSGDEVVRRGVVYTGPWSALQYAEELRETMLTHITNIVDECENSARAQAAKGINAITQLGIMHSGKNNAFERLQFRPEAMFSRKRDNLARQVDIPLELRDFIEWPSLGSQQFASAGMALTLATTVGSRLTEPRGWLDSAFTLANFIDSNSLRRFFLPGVFVTVVAAIVAHILQQIPHTIARRLAVKVGARLSATDYVLVNSSRIAERVRRVLRIPAEDVRNVLDRSVRDLGQRRDEMDKLHCHSHEALQYFEDLVAANKRIEGTVKEIDLETPPGPP